MRIQSRGQAPRNARWRTALYATESAARRPRHETILHAVDTDQDSLSHERHRHRTRRAQLRAAATAAENVGSGCNVADRRDAETLHALAARAALCRVGETRVYCRIPRANRWKLHYS